MLRRVRPKISMESTYAVLKRMTDSGLLERDNAGIYRLPNSSKGSYEPRTMRLLRLVYEAPAHEMTRRGRVAMSGWSAKLLSATASELRSRSLLKYEKSVNSQYHGRSWRKWRLAKGSCIAPGKMFYGQAGGPRVDPSAFTTLRLERPRVHLAQEIRLLRMVKKRELDPALDEAAPRLGIPRGDLEIMVKPRLRRRRSAGSAAQAERG